MRVWSRFSVRLCVMPLVDPVGVSCPVGQAMVWLVVRVSELVCVDGVGSTHCGAQVLLVVVHGAVSVQAVQAPHGVQLTEPVGAGQEAVRVRVRYSGRDWSIWPSCPLGHARVWVLVRFSVSVSVDGDGTTQFGAQVLLVVVHGVLPVHALHGDHAFQV